MTQALRLAVRLGTALVFAGLLAACGGGGSSPAPDAHNFSAGGSNVVAVTVGPGPADANHQTFNIPYVTVTVCQGSTCATIPDVLVDSGSYGLRLMASVVKGAGLTPTPMTDPSTPASTVAECVPFADGYTWGEVSTLNVTIGGETTTAAVPVQIIDDSQPAPTPPSGCSNISGSNNDMNSVNAFDANGVLGVGVFAEDCGPNCASNASTHVYWSCPPGGPYSACIATTMPVADQVANPVAHFATDNNGVILQLPAISGSGAPSAAGYMVFGIGTENNNGLDGATVMTTDTSGDFITTLDSQTLDGSFIDSGSNGLFFPNPASQLPACGSSGGAADFYCPNPTASLNATMQGENGTEKPESFQIADLLNIGTQNFAINDVGGPSGPIQGSSQYFDWGLPFFYGHTIFFAIDGMDAGSNTGPFYAVQ